MNEQGSDSGAESAGLRERIAAHGYRETQKDMSEMDGVDSRPAEILAVSDDTEEVSAAVTPEAKRAREGSATKPAKQCVEVVEDSADLKMLMLANFRIGHNQMEGVISSLKALGSTVSQHSKDIGKLKKALDDTEKRQKNHERTIERGDENKVIFQRLENVEKRTSVPGQVGSTVPPPTSGGSSTSVVSSAGCELVIC